tara:strand:+ start:137 stop:544 length:408 start_codon:yes stop_codon:yes gene_type:complete
MELLYFISGILTVGVGYGVVLLRKVKSSHTELLERYQSQSNISSIRESDFEVKIKDLNTLLLDIQGKMEKDQYASISEINERIKFLEGLISKNTQSTNNAANTFNKDIAEAFSQINQLKRNLNKIGEDPNMVSRY